MSPELAGAIERRLKMLRTLNSDRFSKPHSEFQPGPAPMLTWIEIEKLVVDGEYQRSIGRRGAMNVAQIAISIEPTRKVANSG